MVWLEFNDVAGVCMFPPSHFLNLNVSLKTVRFLHSHLNFKITLQSK